MECSVAAQPGRPGHAVREMLQLPADVGGTGGDMHRPARHLAGQAGDHAAGQSHPGDLHPLRRPRTRELVPRQAACASRGQRFRGTSCVSREPRQARGRTRGPQPRLPPLSRTAVQRNRRQESRSRRLRDPVGTLRIRRYRPVSRRCQRNGPRSRLKGSPELSRTCPVATTRA